MAILSREHGFLFIQSPRTGCTAVGEGVLVPAFGGEKVPPAAILDDEGNELVSSKHATVADLVRHGLVDRDTLRKVLVFTTVRNPFDSLLSGYVKRRGVLHDLAKTEKGQWIHRSPGRVEELEFCREHSFVEWVDWKLTRRSVRTGFLRRTARPRHMQGQWLEGAQHVMKFESLQADLDAVCERLGLTPVPIPQINVTPDRDRSYRDHYDERSRALVEAVFRPDLERFGYEF